jgi:Sec7-like guanine-nucleotide exchange factor
MLVLEVLCELCSEPQHLVEIFLNYDCDLEGIDLFKSIVTSMAYVAKQASMDGAQSHPPSFPHLSEEAVRGLLIILTSLQNAAGHCDEDIHSGEGQLHHQSARALGHRQAWSEGQLPPELLPEKEAHDDLSNDVALPPASHLTARKSYNLKARRQEELETGFIRFNMKPDAGLAWLGTRGHLQHDNPHSVAEFLRLYCDRLDKTVRVSFSPPPIKFNERLSYLTPSLFCFSKRSLASTWVESHSAMPVSM